MVPIVKFDVKNVACDLSVITNINYVGLLNTTLLAFYANYDRRLVPVAHFVKQLAKLYEVNDAQTGSLHSYNWNLLVIFFLQQQNVLPILDEKVIKPYISLTDMAQYFEGLKTTQLKRNSDLSVGQLLVGFYDFYHNYNWDDVVSVRRGLSFTCSSSELILPNDESLLRKCIRIEEPFEGTNTARAVSYKANKQNIEFAIADIRRRFATTGGFATVIEDVEPEKKKQCQAGKPRSINIPQVLFVKTIGKANSKKRRGLQKMISGLKCGVFVKPMAGDVIPVEIFGTQEYITKTAEKILSQISESLVNHEETISMPTTLYVKMFGERNCNELKMPVELTKCGVNMQLDAVDESTCTVTVSGVKNDVLATMEFLLERIFVQSVELEV